MNSSILLDAKKIIGIEETDKTFDTDLILFLNGELLTLYQIGVHTANPSFKIETGAETFLDANLLNTRNEPVSEITVSTIKEYLILKVKLAFDPPSNSTLVSCMKEKISELEFRISVDTDKGGAVNVGV